MASFSLKDFCNRREPASLRVMALLGILALGLVVFLISADKPWAAAVVKRLHSEKGPRLADYITMGMWWGGVAALGSCIAGLLLQKWWSLPSGGAFPREEPAHSPAMRKWVLATTLAAVFLAGWVRQPRLSHGLWNDELMHLRYYTWGAHELQEDGKMKFDPVTWQEALFQNKKGNNHIWASIEARVGHLLGGGTWDGEKPFTEAWLRTLPFLSGLGTVVLIALLGGAMGNARAGFAAALIVAMHPWHARWSVEIRGYSTMMLAITGALYCLIQALQTGRWRWWLGFSAAQTVFLLAFAGSLYVAVAINCVALLLLWRQATPGRDRAAAVTRLLVSGFLSVVPLALIMGPSVPQILAYLRTDHSYEVLNGAWFQDLAASLLSGLSSTVNPEGDGGGLSFQSLAASSLWRQVLLLGILPLLILGGLWILLRQSWRTQLACGTLLVAGLLAVGHNALNHSPMMTWYLLYLIPLLALSLAFAGSWLARKFPTVPLIQSAPLVIAALYAATVLPGLERIRAVPSHTLRQAVLAARGAAPAPANSADTTLTATLGTGAGQHESYDPRVKEINEPAELEALIQQADRESRRLVVYFADAWGLAHPRPGKEKNTGWPEILKLVQAGDRFRKIGDFPATQAMWSTTAWEYEPGETLIRIRPAAAPAAAPGQ